LALSVDIITHLPITGSRLNSGIMQFAPNVMDELYHKKLIISNFVKKI